MSDVASLRRIALSLPEAYEQDHFGGPSWRVAKKIFASCSPEKTARRSSSTAISR
jgi:hypothetical protein